MQIYYPIIVDLNQVGLIPTVKAKQGDSGRGLIATLTNAGQVVSATGNTCRVYAVKPDNTKVYTTCTVTSDGKVQAEFTTQMLAVAGTVQIEFEMQNGNDIVTTPIMKLVVMPTNIDDSAIESQDEFTVLQELIADFTEEVDTCVEQVQTAEQTAITHITAQETTSKNAVQAKGTEVLNSIPEDYTALTQEVGELKSDLKNYGTTNDIPFEAGTSYPSTLTVVAKDYKYTINGTISSYIYKVMFNETSSLPQGVSAGDEVYFGIVAPSSINLQIGQYIGGSWVYESDIINSYKKIKVNSSAVGMQIRFKILAGAYSNVVAYPYMFTTLSKQEVEDSLNALNSELATTNTTVAGIKANMPTAEPKQYINPDTLSVINARVSGGGQLITDNNYRALIAPAEIIANSEYRAKYLGSSVVFSEYRLYSFDAVTIGSYAVNKTDSYSSSETRLRTTANANYFVLVMSISSGTVEDAIAESVIAQATAYPTEYTPYYISVDDAINNSIGKYTSPDCIEVGTNSDKYEYTDINTAVVANPNSVIHVNYGTYETEVANLATNKKLIGKDRDLCILTGTNKDYDTPPIEIAGGIVKNFTIDMANDPNTSHAGYCLHSDNSATANNTLLVENCKFTCTGQHSVGLGIRGGETVIFDNCVFEQNDGVSKRVPIYAHNSSGTSVATMKFHNCYFKGYDYCMKLQAYNSDCAIQFEFIDCTCISEVYGTTDDCVWTDHVSGDAHDTTKMHSFSGKFTLLHTSHGNNIAVLNA